MNIFKLSIVTALLCMSTVFCFGQDDFDGQVINKTTEAPLVGVTVRLLKGKIATQTNERGYYSLSNDEPQPDDTLQYSYVGYKTLRLAVSAYEPQMFIVLEPLVVQLEEVRISNGKTQSAVLGHFSAYDLKWISSSLGSKRIYFISSTTTIAKHFLAPQPNAVLMSVALGRQDHYYSPSWATQNKLTKFKVKVYGQNPFTKVPETLLFSKDISLTDNSKRVDIDLSNYKIVIPGNNFFVAVEWIVNPYNEIIVLGGGKKVDKVNKKGVQFYKDASFYIVDYQPFLIGYDRRDDKENAALYQLVDKKWIVYKQFDAELALSATVNY